VEGVTQWRGRPDTVSRSRFAKLFALSVLLHLPLTPVVALLGLLQFLKTPVDDDTTPAPALTAIPVDLFEAEEPAAPAPPPAPTEPAQPTASTEDPEATKKKPEIRDAGADEPDAEITDAGDEAAAALTDAESDAGEAGPGGEGRSIADPTAGVGSARVVDPNANVRLLVHMSRVREHPLGKQIGPMLRAVYQWRDFFGPTAIDPVRDIDTLMLVGPQLRDSSQVVAILQHHVPEDQMRKAVDALVVRDTEGGHWLDAGVPAAIASADRAPRVFVMPSSRIVVVATPTTQDAALKLPRKFSLPKPKNQEAVLLHLATPHRAVRGLPIRVPESIKWARILVTPLPDGGALAEVEAEDESEESARQNAEYLERAINALTELNLGLLGDILGTGRHRFIEKSRFTSEGNKIHGSTRATAEQLSTILGFASATLTEMSARRSRNAARNDAGTPAVPTPAPTPAPIPTD
jgi:hypothetical protein